MTQDKDDHNNKKSPRRSWRNNPYGKSRLIIKFMSNASAKQADKKILVVDDNEVILKTISLKLRGAGYQVVTALEGSEAMSAARKEIPDLILLDISFPLSGSGMEWDGFRMMEWFNRLEAVKKIPIIVISGSEELRDKERALAAGAVAFFQKPIDHDDLLKVIRATLSTQAVGGAS